MCALHDRRFLATWCRPVCRTVAQGVHWYTHEAAERKNSNCWGQTEINFINRREWRASHRDLWGTKQKWTTWRIRIIELSRWILWRFTFGQRVEQPLKCWKQQRDRRSCCFCGWPTKKPWKWQSRRSRNPLKRLPTNHLAQFSPGTAWFRHCLIPLSEVDFNEELQYSFLKRFDFQLTREEKRKNSLSVHQ